jgi:hypothetical protein
MLVMTVNLVLERLKEGKMGGNLCLRPRVSSGLGHTPSG